MGSSKNDPEPLLTLTCYTNQQIYKCATFHRKKRGDFGHFVFSSRGQKDEWNY